MAKATINTKTGSVITVEGDEKDIVSIIKKLESPSIPLKENAGRKGNSHRRDSAPDLIVGLRDNDFFSQPRTLNDIVDALAEKGYAYPATTLSGVMINLVKNRVVGRKKVEGKWVYGK